MPRCKKGRTPAPGNRPPRFRCRRCGLKARKKSELCKAKGLG